MELESYGYAESVEIREEIRPNKQAVIKAKIVLIDRSVLHIKEYIDARYKMRRFNKAVVQPAFLLCVRKKLWTVATWQGKDSRP
jgi:hypothetical protein